MEEIVLRRKTGRTPIWMSGIEAWKEKVVNLVAAIEIYGGGPGSGCKGPNCGRQRLNKLAERTKVFYHFTRPESVDSILKEGLKPSERGTTAYGRYGVYMTSDSEEMAGRGLALLKIRVPETVSVSRDHSGATWYIAKGHIKPEHIDVLDRGEIRKSV